MQIQIPNDLFAALEKKAKAVYPDSQEAANLALGNLIRYFVNSRDESVLTLDTSEGKMLTLSEINDSFFEQFVQACRPMYPGSDKPEVDFLMDCMASLVNVDSKVILMSGIPAEYEDKLRRTLDAAFGGGSQAIYQLLGKLLLKAKNNRVIAVEYSKDDSTPNFDDPKYTLVVEGIDGEKEAPKFLNAVGMMLTKIIRIFGTVGVIAMRRLDRLVNDLFETKDGALTLFSEILKSADKGKLTVTNMQNAPIYSRVGDNTKGDNCVIICNIPDRMMENFAVYSKALAHSFKTQLNVTIKDYEGPTGFLVYLMDVASVDSKEFASASFELDRLSKIFSKELKDGKEQAEQEGVDFSELQDFFNTDGKSTESV